MLDFPFHFEVKGTKRSHIEVGELGEKMAATFLRRQHVKVLYRNYRGPKGGELDVVARDRDVLSFIEVKTRKRRAGSRPLDAVNAEKQELIERGARSWLKLLPHNDFLWRFDVMEVVLEENELPKLCWVKDAF
ncbi:YraN family protein [Rubritalea sp.]|uniref:YraN family protein n=1 Tax=Rubritalea sp. TaxID=2109375 RepID=UPI003F4AC3B8